MLICQKFTQSTFEGKCQKYSWVFWMCRVHILYFLKVYIKILLISFCRSKGSNFLGPDQSLDQKAQICCWSKLSAQSKSLNILTLDRKLNKKAQNLLPWIEGLILRIKSCYSGSSVRSKGSKMVLVWIESSIKRLKSSWSESSPR